MWGGFERETLLILNIKLEEKDEKKK